jgi:adenosine deaminase
MPDSGNLLEALMRYSAGWLILLVLVLGERFSTAQTSSPEQRTIRYMDSVRHQKPVLLAFLRDMPKGGDLHNHLAGALQAENLIDFAVDDGLCVDRTTSFLIAPPCDASCDKYTSQPRVRCAYQDQVLYNSIVDAWSMRNWERGSDSGHDHFFATFDKFLLATLNHAGDSLAQAASQAAHDHLQYVELMNTADGMRSPALGAKTGWDPELPKLREKLLAGGLKEIVTSTRKDLDSEEARMHSRLNCGAAQADPGCKVTIRYLYQVLRGLPPQQVFAQMVTGFELAQGDSRVVGLNLVMPEDWYVPMHDFDLHMQMLDYLHAVYPKVHISLHAGELALGLVPPEGLRSHIRKSIERGHAERIGHGVDIMNEDHAIDLLHQMAAKNILVEICLTSNDEILGVRENDHPFPVYRRYGVPVALATDDEGVSRSDLTHDYMRAVESYGLSYVDLKRMARHSLEHSFLPGPSLWTDAQHFRTVASCTLLGQNFGTISVACRKFLDGSERARLQWQLEEALASFEKNF